MVNSEEVIQRLRELQHLGMSLEGVPNFV
jgi:hypothetical protein